MATDKKDPKQPPIKKTGKLTMIYLFTDYK